MLEVSKEVANFHSHAVSKSRNRVADRHDRLNTFRSIYSSTPQEKVSGDVGRE